MLFYLLVAYGLCFGVQNKLSFLYSHQYRDGGDPEFRDRLLLCPYCTGFHCGWVVWFLAWGVEGKPPAGGVSGLFSVIAWALCSAAFCYASDTIMTWFESRSKP